MCPAVAKKDNVNIHASGTILDQLVPSRAQGNGEAIPLLPLPLMVKGGTAAALFCIFA